jgi:hypothetical protein
LKEAEEKLNEVMQSMVIVTVAPCHH